MTLTADHVTNSHVLIDRIRAEFPDAMEFRFGAGFAVGQMGATPFVTADFVSDGQVFKAGFGDDGFWWEYLGDCPSLREESK